MAAVIGYSTARDLTKPPPTHMETASTLPPATTTTSRPPWLSADDSMAKSSVTLPSKGTGCAIGFFYNAGKCLSLDATTIKPRPSRPVCPNGGFGVWIHSEWCWNECRQSSPPVCRSEFPYLPWVAGEWGCYETCTEGTMSVGEDGRARCICDDGYEAADVDGDRVCIFMCDEGDWREIMEGSEGRVTCWIPKQREYYLDILGVPLVGQICVPPSDLADRFQADTLLKAGVPELERSGRWIGGLASRYGIEAASFFSADEAKYWKKELGIYGKGERAALGNRSAFFLYPVHADHIAEVRGGRGFVHVCYGHDCFKEGNCPDGESGLDGSSDELITCDVYIWDEVEGLFFVMQIDDTEPECVEAYNRVAAKIMNQAGKGGCLCYDDPYPSMIVDGMEHV